jgi:hypothetical protein
MQHRGLRLRHRQPGRRRLANFCGSALHTRIDLEFDLVSTLRIPNLHAAHFDTVRVHDGSFDRNYEGASMNALRDAVATLAALAVLAVAVLLLGGGPAR